MKSYFLAIILTITSLAALSQSRYNVESCWNMAKSNYTLIKSLDLINKSKEYSLSNANKTILPDKVSFTSFENPNQNSIKVTNETVTKNQGNKITSNSFLFNNNKPLISKNETIAQDASSLDNMYTLSDRINNLYFSLILIDKKIKLNELFQLQIDEVIKGVSSNKKSNTKSNISSLESLKKVIIAKHLVLSNQQKIYLNMLSQMTGKTIDEKTILIEPNIQQYMGSSSRSDIELNNNALRITSKTPSMRFGNNNIIIDDNFKVFDITKTAIKNNTVSDSKTNISNNIFSFNSNKSSETELNEINKLSKLINFDEEQTLKYKEILDVTYSKVLRGVTDISNLVQDLLTYDDLYHTLAAHKVQMMMAINKYRLIYQK